MADKEPLNVNDDDNTIINNTIKSNGQIIIVPAINGINNKNNGDNCDIDANDTNKNANNTIIKVNGVDNGVIISKLIPKNTMNGFSNHNGIGGCGDDDDDDNVRKSHQQEPPDGGIRAWSVMICAFLCNGIIFGIINTYSVFNTYLQQELTDKNDHDASSKAALVGALAIGATFLVSPISGMLTDKIGLRRTTFIGGLLCASGMLLSSFFTHKIEALCFTYGIMFGTGAALAYTPTLAILGHYFKKYLGIVSGFVTAGSSVFTIILSPALKHLVNTFPIPVAFEILSAFTALIMVFAIVYKPLHPPPEPPKKKSGRSGLNMLIRSFLNVDIWKKKRYLIWALCVPLALFGYFVTYVHMGTFVKSIFKDKADESWPLMCIGISSGIGRIIFGFLADLPKVNRILLQQFSLTGIGVLTMLLPLTNSFTILLVITFIMGLFDGCFISLLGPIAYEICGPQGATQAIGFLLGLSSIPLTIGPPIAGKIYDLTGSYTIPLILAGIPAIVGANMMFLIRCVRDDDNNSNNIIKKEVNDLPLAKKNWDEESKHDGPLQNGTSHHLMNSIAKESSGITSKSALLNHCSSMSSLVCDCDPSSTLELSQPNGRRYTYSIF